MNRIVYLDGAFVAEAEAKVSVFDRGFLFADAIYEVTAVARGKLLDYPGHAARLRRSMHELGLACPLDAPSLLALHREIVARNGIDEGLVYLQLTRGGVDRDYVIPTVATPTLLLFTQARPVLRHPKAESGIGVITLPDLRWKRRDIKTVQLLYASMAKTEALARGADDAWLVEDGLVTEAASANAHIVTRAGILVTRPLGTDVLHGITRASVLDLARGAGLPVEERPFTPEEAYDAAEAFVTSATTFVLPVVRIDDRPIGGSVPGPVVRHLRALYIEDRLAGAL